MGVLSGTSTQCPARCCPSPSRIVLSRAPGSEDSSEANQKLHISHQPFFFPDRRQQFLLHVDDDESALARPLVGARHLGVVGVDWNH